VLKIGSVLSLMEQRYAEPLTLEQLAREGHLSERSLHRSFHQALGCSPMEYLTRIRLQRAQELLKRSGATVTEVAHSVGFSDSSYFSRKFRQAVGVSPRDWQRRRT
jgi:transcriptional regulator GlxA family with amidase domain